MNLTIIIGWVLALGMVVFGIMNGGEFSQFIDVPSLAIVIGGTLGVLIAVSPLSFLKRIPKLFKIAIAPPKYDPHKYIDQIVEYAKVARSKGLLALEDSANKCEDAFMKQGLMLIVDANDPGKVRQMLEDSLDFMSERHAEGSEFFGKGVSLAPAFGMLGTLVGLVIMLNNMDNGDLGSAMATALITTFYGSLISNVIFTPLEAALKNTHNAEILCMEIVIEGVIAIAAGSNPRVIQEKLEFMLPKSEATSGSGSE
ncbi:MAG: motility protein A [Bacteroides sp.]|nr:motility protein A [Eubacterium sp.]MCM1419466.1 motility protein A [Roseburia sp.]MCM1463326.1 motility protein A [Bacteroides sp.]